MTDHVGAESARRCYKPWKIDVVCQWIIRGRRGYDPPRCVAVRCGAASRRVGSRPPPPRCIRISRSWRGRSRSSRSRSRSSRSVLEGPVAAVGSGRCELGSIEVPSRASQPSSQAASCLCTVRQRLTLPVCVSVASCQYFSGRSTVCSPLTSVFSSGTFAGFGCTTIRRVAVGLRSRVVDRPLRSLFSRRYRPSRQSAVCLVLEIVIVIVLWDKDRCLATPASWATGTPADTHRFRHVESLPAAASVFVPWRIAAATAAGCYCCWLLPPSVCLALLVAPIFSRGRSAPSRLGRSRNVVMAGTSRRPSSELGPDLSSPTPPKKSKFSEASSCEQDPELGIEDLETSEILDTSVPENTVELIPGRIPGICSFEISEESLDGTKQLIQASLEGPGKVKPGSSKEGHFGNFETIVQMKYGQQEQSGSSSRKLDTDCNMQIQTSLLGEDAFYQELSLIGNGAYGTVYKAKDLNSGQVVALKKVRVPLTEDGLPSSTLREIATLKQLERFEHPHIVRLLDVCQGNYLHLPSTDGLSERLDRGLTLWLVFEHVDRDLESYMSACSRQGIPPELVKQMSREILRGVEFLHSHRIIHRDLKPQNLLVSREGRIKIADFGLAKTYDFEMRLTSVVVTQWYRAPEVLLGCSYATPVDMWSVGCILAELNRLEPLFPGTSEGDQLDRIFRVIGMPSQEEWPENVSLSWTAFPYRQPKPLSQIIPNLDDHGRDLIKYLLLFDPHSRLTAAQALKHRYFDEDNS